MPSDTDAIEVQAKPALMLERLNLEFMLADFTPERFCYAAGRIRNLRQSLKELDEFVKQTAIDHIEQHGPFVVGETRFYTGIGITTRCRDPRATAQAILEVADVDTLLDCLSATAIKQGAAKRVDGLDFNDHFEVVRKEELREGKPKLALLEAKPKYLK
jgi:hypothetical protein